MVPTKHADHQNEEQVGGDADERRHKRPVEHDVAQPGEVGDDVQRHRVELDVARLDLDKYVAHGPGLREKKKAEYIFISTSYFDFIFEKIEKRRFPLNNLNGFK